MALHDIMPYMAPRGGHDNISSARLGALSTSAVANTSFRVGEVLLLDVAVGDVNVIADGVEAVTTNHYIAADSSAGLIAHYNFAEAAATHDCLVHMYPLTGPNASEFVSENAVSGSDTILTAAQMAAILVGDTVGLWRDNTAVATGPNGTFAIDTGSTGLKITRKLDALGRDSDISGQACTAFVVISDGV